MTESVHIRFISVVYILYIHNIYIYMYIHIYYKCTNEHGTKKHDGKKYCICVFYKT